MAHAGGSTNPAVTRVLLADMPAMLAEVVAAAIEQGPDLRIVGVIRDDADALAAAARDADVLIVSHAPAVPLPVAYARLLAATPALRILSVTTESDVSVLYWMGLRSRKQSVVTMAQLTKVIRRARQIDPLR